MAQCRRAERTEQQANSLAGSASRRLHVLLQRQLTPPDASGDFTLDWRGVDVMLCDADHTNPRWFEHPIHGRAVDIAVVDVTDIVSGQLVNCVNELESDAALELLASHDVFIFGFPFSAMSMPPSPIWKRGTLAMVPEFEHEGLPKLLIDTATREGMSGSVAIARQIVLGRTFRRKDGSEAPGVIMAIHNVVVGVYSGRHYPDLEKAQLGIVWK